MKLKHYMFAFLVAMLSLCIEAKGQETGDSTAVNTMERIIRFHSDLVLGRDNKMEVTEHIRIYAKGDVFVHGLKRSIPHKRPLPSGVRLEVPIDIRDVKLGGEAVQYDTETDGDNVVVYIGDADTTIPEGEYDYTITYSADGQIGVYDKYDEIYWNVNGFEWAVPFDTLSATVTIPDGTKILGKEAYTGGLGDKGKEYTATDDGRSKISFCTTRAFNGGENMTIAVSFSKGSQPELTWWDIWRDDVMAFVVCIIYILFCIITWIKRGIDPKKPTVIPEYKVFKGISPALAGRILGFQDGSRLTMATILSLLVHGAATISQKGKKEYIIAKGGNKPGKELEEIAYNKLFAEGRNSVSTKEDETVLGELSTEICKHISKKYDGYYYEHNYLLLSSAIFLFLGLFFFIATLDNMHDMSLIPFLASFIVLIWYACVIGRYTMSGIKMRAKMEGLKMYIKTAEERQMRDLTPEHFEELLPYAMAFDLENRWCKKFEKALAECNYEPQWYTYTAANYAYASLLSDGGMKSLVNGISDSTQHTISSYASSHSGSWSSASGGGGFSGGGGGGGGGGGW